jgi:nucleoside-diphosphate-sugar epimerase
MPSQAVTGGAGFIGSHIVEALLSRGDEVLVIDDLSSGKRENLKGLEPCRLYATDLATEPRLADYLAGVDTVFHQAAVASVSRSIRDPKGSHRANVDATLNLLEACVRAGVRRVVYASSSAVYGDSATLPTHEDAPPRPISPYGAQKHCSEMYMQAFWRSYGLETVALRYFNVFGPRQDASSPYSGVIAKFISALLAPERPVIYGDGLQTRDFIYVSNVVEANLSAGRAPDAAGGVFNVAGGVQITLRNMLESMQSIVGSDMEPLFEEARAGDIRHSQADITRITEQLDWTPGTGFHAGLIKTVDWYRAGA